MSATAVGSMHVWQNVAEFCVASVMNEPQQVTAILPARPPSITAPRTHRKKQETPSQKPSVSVKNMLP